MNAAQREQMVLDTLVKHGEILDKIDRRTELQNGRIRELERWRAFICGGLAVISVLLIPLLISTVNAWAG